MIREEKTTMSGRIIVILTPENDEDRLELQRLAEEGVLDSRDGFSSDPSVWKRVPQVGNGTKPQQSE